MSFITPAVIFIESQSTVLLALMGLGTAPVAAQIGVLCLLSLATAASIFFIGRRIVRCFSGSGGDDKSYGLPDWVLRADRWENFDPEPEPKPIRPSIFAKMCDAVSSCSYRVRPLFNNSAGNDPSERDDPEYVADQIRWNNLRNF